MEIETNKTENNLFIKLTGRLDTATSTQLEALLKREINGVEHLEFDFSGLEYLSSAGLRVLLSAQKVMNRQGDMVITNVNDTILEIFDITGFSEILTINW